MKMRLAFTVLLLSASVHMGHAQVTYAGFIDKYPIQLTTNVYSDGMASAIYAYDRYDTPIPVNGDLKNGVLTLYERNAQGAEQAKFVFQHFSGTASSLQGEWINRERTKKLKVTLTKTFDVEKANGPWKNKEILQRASTDQHYFKLLLSKDQDAGVSVTGVKILEKKTDRLIQQLPLECEWIGFEGVGVDDYNFDGVIDFSVFEATYAGPNTSSIYFLRTPDTEKYFRSEFSGTSLEFDHAEKLIYESNQCCAGRRRNTATYKVVNNKMVLVRQRCLEYNEEKDDYIEVKCE